jgi:hypothetical protein
MNLSFKYSKNYFVDASMMHSQLFKGLKCESQTKNNGRQEVEARSLARSTIEG